MCLPLWWDCIVWMLFCICICFLIRQSEGGDARWRGIIATLGTAAAKDCSYNVSPTRKLFINTVYEGEQMNIRMMQGFLSGGDIGATGQENIGAIWRWRSASRNAGSDMKCSHSSHSAVNPVINLKYQPLRSMLKACHSLIRTNQIFRLVPDFQYRYLELQTNHHNHGEGPLW